MATKVAGGLAWPEAATPEAGARTLAVVLDHTHARIFLVDDARAAELPCLVSPRLRGGRFHGDSADAPGWGEGGFHGRRREEERRHYAGVARRIGALVRAHGTRGIVLAGTHVVVAALERSLPRRLARMVVGTARLAPTDLTSAQVLTAVRDVRRAGGLDGQDTLVTAMVEGLGTGRAVDGFHAVLRALARDQVRTLLVGRTIKARAGYRCAASGRLVLTKAEAEGEAVVRVPDLAAAARVDTERLGGSVAEIRDPRQAARFDEIAALLRFPVS